MRRKVNNLHDLITVTPQGDGNSFFHCKSSFWHPPVRFNYRYPVRGRKLKLIGNFVALATDLITVIEIGNRALTKLSMRGESFSWLRI